MAARFNRHRPALCEICTGPLSVKERIESDGRLCIWHLNDAVREALAKVEQGSFWISEPSGPMIEDAEARVVTVDPGELFGFHVEE